MSPKATTPEHLQEMEGDHSARAVPGADGETFADLKFEPDRHHDGIGARHFWPNGYGVSVIRNRYSYGGEDGLYELAVLRRVEGGWDIVYDTPVTQDVEGHLSPEAVTELMAQVAALPARGERL